LLVTHRSLRTYSFLAPCPSPKFLRHFATLIYFQRLTRFLREELKLKVNPHKSAVDRPWKRKFLGFSLTSQKESRVRVAPQSVKRFEDKLREKFREGRGRNLKTFLESLKPLLRGWANYFSVAQTRGVFEELDQWIRRKLRCMEWRKWKCGRRRMQRMTALGLERERDRTSAFNGHGPWWNAGAPHLNAALPTSYFRKLGLISILEEVNWRTALREAASL
jgi:RNA-directed DNA polymerase